MFWRLTNFMRDKKFYQREYVDKKKSVREISREQNTYPTKIYRELTQFGFNIKGKSEIQKERLKTVPHPTKGKHRTEREKHKIGKGVSENWKSLPRDEVLRRVNENLNVFGKMSKKEEAKIRKLAAQEIHRTAKRGSKIERFFVDKLTSHGYKVIWHKEIPHKEKMIVDIYLPDEKIVIEVDGISHFEPIWGEDKLKQQQRADKEKNGILTGYGLSVIRFKVSHRNYNLTKLFNAFEKLLESIQKIVDGKRTTLVHASDE